MLWARGAAEAVLARAKGSPYLLQLFGQACWQAAQPGPGDLISEQAAIAGIAAAERELWNGMFRGRWAKAGPAERQLLAAVAATIDAEGTANTADIAQYLGRSATQLSGARRRLIDKGLLEATGYARLAFTMPGFEDFVRAENPAGPASVGDDTIRAVRRRDAPRPELPAGDRNHDAPAARADDSEND